METEKYTAKQRLDIYINAKEIFIFDLKHLSTGICFAITKALIRLNYPDRLDAYDSEKYFPELFAFRPDILFGVDYYWPRVDRESRIKALNIMIYKTRKLIEK